MKRTALLTEITTLVQEITFDIKVAEYIEKEGVI